MSELSQYELSPRGEKAANVAIGAIVAGLIGGLSLYLYRDHQEHNRALTESVELADLMNKQAHRIHAPEQLQSIPVIAADESVLERAKKNGIYDGPGDLVRTSKDEGLPRPQAIQLPDDLTPQTRTEIGVGLTPFSKLPVVPVYSESEELYPPTFDLGEADKGACDDVLVASSHELPGTILSFEVDEGRCVLTILSELSSVDPGAQLIFARA